MMATTQPLPAGPSVQLRRLFDATRDRVFSAWTERDRVAEWLCRAPAFRTEHLQFDARPGGRYLIRNTTPGGDVHTAEGEFREVAPPARLSFTWGGITKRAAGGPTEELRDTLVVVEFFERGKQTEVVLTHYGLPTDALRNNHAKGWKICFDGLEAVL
jgi:uncharacterized protein YndB with AHSA1/START domain